MKPCFSTGPVQRAGRLAAASFPSVDTYFLLRWLRVTPGSCNATLCHASFRMSREIKQGTSVEVTGSNPLLCALKVTEKMLVARDI